MKETVRGSVKEFEFLCVLERDLGDSEFMALQMHENAAWRRGHLSYCNLTMHNFRSLCRSSRKKIFRNGLVSDDTEA